MLLFEKQSKSDVVTEKVKKRKIFLKKYFYFARYPVILMWKIGAMRRFDREGDRFEEAMLSNSDAGIGGLSAGSLCLFRRKSRRE